MRAWLGLIAALAAVAAPGWTLSAGDAGGWEPRRLSVRVNTEGCDLPAERVHAAVDRAVAVWNGVPTADVRVVRSTETFTMPASEFLAAPLADTPAVLCDPDFGKAHGVDAHFVPAATRLWTVDDRLGRGAIFLNAELRTGGQIRWMTDDQLTVTLAHELGHLLGLGHSSAQTSLMYYSIAGKTSPALSDDDRDGLTYLYPRNEFSGGAFGCAAVHRPTRAPAGPAAVAFFFLLASVLIVGRALRVRPERLP